MKTNFVRVLFGPSRGAPGGFGLKVGLKGG